MTTLKPNSKRKSSNLLVNDTPIIVIPALCKVFNNDIIKSMILQHIHYFARNKRNMKENESWVYTSISNLHKKYFPFSSEPTLTRKMKELVDDKILVTGNFNKMKYDRTKWYRINYDVLGKHLKNYKRNIYNNSFEEMSDEEIQSLNMNDANEFLNISVNQTDSFDNQNNNIIESEITNQNVLNDITYTKEKTEENTLENNCIENKIETIVLGKISNDILPSVETLGDIFRDFKLSDRKINNSEIIKRFKRMYESN